MGRKKVGGEGGNSVYKGEIEKIKRGSRKKERGKRVDSMEGLQCEDGRKRGTGEEGKRRVSKDKGVNGQGGRVDEMRRWKVEGERWNIMNGAKEENKEGKMMFTGKRGEMIIDYER